MKALKSTIQANRSLASLPLVFLFVCRTCKKTVSWNLSLGTNSEFVHKKRNSKAGVEAAQCDATAAHGLLKERSCYGQIRGYRFKEGQIGKTTLMPYASIQHGHYEHLNEDMNFTMWASLAFKWLTLKLHCLIKTVQSIMLGEI